MKKNKQELDAIINHVTSAIREEHIDPSMVDESATRVWARVSQHAVANDLATSELGTQIMNTSNATEQIRGCDDFQSLIPAYLRNELSNARKLLLEDHSNECIPCRRELKAQRAGATTPALAGRRVESPSQGWLLGWTRSNALRWSFAAGLAVVFGLGGLFLYGRLDLSGTTLAATLENANGPVYVVSDAETRLLAAGEQLKKGEHVRTAKDSNAVLKLADGSSIEMRERSEFSVTETTRGVTVHLDRGDVIVEAAKQHNGRLYVETPDSLVSVKGTIFAVESGTKGSRVSVVEGEVAVNHGGQNETLLPGDQTTTTANLDRTSVQQNVSWSRNAKRYVNLVSDLVKLQREVNQKVAKPGVRYSSRFLDIVPANTVFYASLPNLTETLAESQRVMQERIKQNPALAEWWKDNGRNGMKEQTLARILEFGSQLGDEIVVTAEMDAKGEPNGILVLGQLKNAAGFRTYLEGQLANMPKELGDAPNVRIIDDPSAAVVSSPAPVNKKTVASKVPGPRSELFVWINNDTFAASPQIERLRGLASTQKSGGANSFVGSAFHQRIADVYRDGAGLVVAADLEKIVAQAVSKNTSADADRQREGLKQLGVMNLRHFVVEQKQVSGKTLSRAALTFNESHRGIASWLAAPGSMGALDFISPNANVATAFVVKEPTLLADDLLGFMETVQPELRRHLQEIEKSQGFDIRNDFAAPLGGEFAFAIDGPILPTPSWKIVLEVYDQAKLQSTFERAVEKLNQFSALHGKGQLTLESSAVGDRTYYAIKSSDGALGVHYTYANGYLVAAPSRALIEQSIANRDSGNTLVRSSRFMSALPQDGNANFSAIFYHDLASLMSQLPDKVKTAGGPAANLIDPNAPPTLAYAYAEGDRITLSANTDGGAFGLSPASLIGLPNSFEMQHILMNAMGDKHVQKKHE